MTLPRPPRVEFAPTHYDQGVMQEIADFLSIKQFPRHSQAVVRFALHFTKRAIVMSRRDTGELGSMLELTRLNTTNMQVRR